MHEHEGTLLICVWSADCVQLHGETHGVQALRQVVLPPHAHQEGASRVSDGICCYWLVMLSRASKAAQGSGEINNGEFHHLSDHGIGDYWTVVLDIQARA